MRAFYALHRPRASKRANRHVLVPNDARGWWTWPSGGSRPWTPLEEFQVAALGSYRHGREEHGDAGKTPPRSAKACKLVGFCSGGRVGESRPPVFRGRRLPLAGDVPGTRMCGDTLPAFAVETPAMTISTVAVARAASLSSWLSESSVLKGMSRYLGTVSSSLSVLATGVLMRTLFRCSSVILAHFPPFGGSYPL